MENEKKNNGTLVGILIGIIIMLLVGVCLFATGTISFKTTTNSNNEQTSGNEQQNEDKIYDADEYVTLEDFKVSDKITIKKVKFNHLDDNLTKEFYSKQDIILNSLHAGSEQYTAEHKLDYFINNNILSILYMVEETDAIGTCAATKAVTNIDLANNRVITEEELLQKAGTSYRKIVEDRYEKELQTWKENQSFEYDEVTFDDFSNNKEKYVNKGMKKIADFIYTYIENGKIKYDYYTISLDTLFHPVGKGGCFTWETITLGEYK